MHRNTLKTKRVVSAKRHRTERITGPWGFPKMTKRPSRNECRTLKAGRQVIHPVVPKHHTSPDDVKLTSESGPDLVRMHEVGMDVFYGFNPDWIRTMGYFVSTGYWCYDGYINTPFNLKLVNNCSSNRLNKRAPKRGFDPSDVRKSTPVALTLQHLNPPANWSCSRGRVRRALSRTPGRTSLK